MNVALGVDYSASWSRDHVLGSLEGLTVEQALVQGVEVKVVWRAVHGELGLPPSAR